MIADFYGGPPTGKISEIAAVQSGNGIGQALMAAAETWARERSRNSCCSTHSKATLTPAASTKSKATHPNTSPW